MEILFVESHVVVKANSSKAKVKLNSRELRNQEKDLKTTEKARIKLSEAILSILGDLIAGKNLSVPQINLGGG